MKKRYITILSLLICISLAGCSNSTSNFYTSKDASYCYPNYILDNGQKLLGNNNYPAIAYSGHRKVERTVKNTPDIEETKEDLKILSAMGIKLLRTYNTTAFPHSERILEAIRQLRQEDPDFEMYVMLGAWIQCKNAFKEGTDHSIEDFEWNKNEIEAGIRLAAQYPDIVKIIAVGNEAMVTWQVHFVNASVILKWVNTLKEARTTGQIPARTLITTSDNWAALGGMEQYHNEHLLELLKQVDFVSLHTYAFHDTYYDPALQWSVPPGESTLPLSQQVEKAIQRAIDHQAAQYNAVKDYLEKNGIEKEIHVGETGWASLDNSHYGNNGTCAASEYNAKLFYDAIKKWTTENNLTCFYFEAFDEPWKSSGTAGSEGHFGLFTVDGKAKYAIWDRVDAGAFKGLSRGGNPIVKTHNGKKTAVLNQMQTPVFKKFN